MEWSNEKVLSLIGEYRKRPVLWDSSDNNYKNKHKKEKAWRDIAEVMKSEVSEVKKKINSLLASFRRVRRKLKSGIGADEVCEAKWFAFKSMKFLRNKNIPKRVQDTDDNETDTPGIEMNDNIADYEMFEQTDNIVTSTNQSAEGCQNQIPKHFTMPRVHYKKEMEEDHRITDTYSIMKSIATANRDDCACFGEYIACKLRSHDAYTRAMVQHQITNILFNADMGMYSEANTKVTPSPAT